MASSFRFTTHALDELKERQIAKSIVLKVLENPGQVVPAYGGRKCYQSKVKITGKEYLIRVIVDEQTDPFAVVTAYRTSKIDKYWSKA